MRWILLVLVMACGKGRDDAPPKTAPSGEARLPKPAAASIAVSTAVAESTPPIGAPAKGPATPTPERVKARNCTASPPVELGTGDAAVPTVAAAFGANGGLVAWSPRTKRLAVRPIDRNGQPTAAPREVDVPANLDRISGLRALDDHYIVFLGEVDYSGTSPRKKLFALVVGADGGAIGKPLQVAIGDRGMIDDISQPAARGVLIYAGATPATNVNTARLIALHIAADGVITQSTRDYPDPTPGTRANAKFSFSSEHAVVVLPEHVIVDGTIRESKDDPDSWGLLVAPTFSGFSGDKVPIVGISGSANDMKHRYGTLALDGTRKYSGAAVSETVPLRPPFEKTQTWSTGFSVAEGVSVNAQKLSLAGISSGIWTSVVWSGEQALVLYTAGPKIMIVALPCES